MKYFLFISAFFCLVCGFGQASGPGDVLSFRMQGKSAVFQCENGVEVHLQQVGDGLLKISYVREEFPLPGLSFAVILDEEDAESLHITEQTRDYKIYTGSLIVHVDKSPFQIRVFDKYQKLLMEDYPGQGFVFDSLSISSSKILKPGERIYGLGEKNGSLNRVGGSFRMWNSDRPCYTVHEDPLYKSIPFYLSSEGYGIYFDNTFRSDFDFGATGENRLSFSASGGQMVYYFIYGPSLKQMISRYTELTGKAIMPPAWALGFSQSRGLLTNEKLTREIAAAYRSRQIPCDIIYQDIGWTRHLQDFEWHPDKYEDPVQMLDDLGREGFKVVVSQDPVISQANKKQWEEADSLGYFALDSRTGRSYDMPWPWGGNCGVVDFTKPEVADWWGAYQQKPIDDGVKGFWTDMGEPAWCNEESTDRLFMQHHSGPHEEIHNVYGFTWDRVVTEQFYKRNPGQRVFQMTRAGFAGMQRYTFGWSGDAGNGNQVTDGWSQLAAQVPLAMSAGLGLIPFWSCDISGYCGDIEDYESMSELYIRWLQFGAFNPLSRIHHEGDNAVEPWLFGEEAEAICKKAIETKYRLFPYIYSYAREAYDKGWPLVRPLVMEYPDDPEVYELNSQFLFGEEMLVAPVVEEGAFKQRIYLPEGAWIDYHDRQSEYAGGQWIDYELSLEYIPLFIRKGSIIPHMPVMQYIHQDPAYPLVLEVFPASTNRKARFSVYEDDGETNGYKDDAYLTRKIVCASKKDHYEIRYTVHSHQPFEGYSRDLAYKLQVEEKPSSVRLAGKKLKTTRAGKLDEISGEALKKAAWYWDSYRQQCVILVPSAMAEEVIVIEK